MSTTGRLRTQLGTSLRNHWMDVADGESATPPHPPLSKFSGHDCGIVLSLVDLTNVLTPILQGDLVRSAAMVLGGRAEIWGTGSDMSDGVQTRSLPWRLLDKARNFVCRRAT